MNGSDHGTNVTPFPIVDSDGGDVAGLVAIIRRLATAHSASEIMEIVTHAARTLLRADGVTFVLREGELCHYADEDAIAPLWKGRRFPMEACISGWCMIHDQTVTIPDIREDARIPQDAYRPTFVRSLAMAPVRHEEPIAAIGAYWSTTRHINPGEVELLQTIANASGLALSVARQARDANAAKARYSAVFNQAAVGVARVSPEGAFLEVNDRFCRITGFERAELLGTTFQDITHPADLSADLGQAAALIAGEIDTYTIEKRYVGPAGDPVWVNLTCSLVRTGEGAPDYAIAVIEDITKRKEGEVQQARLLELIERSVEIVALANPDGRLAYMNGPGRRALGLEDAALDTVNLADYAAPAYQDLFSNVILPTAREAGVWQGEMQVANQCTGAVTDVQGSIFAFRDLGGKITGFGSVASDVTLLKAAASAEQARAEEFHTLADNIPTLCWMAYADGHIYWYNRRWRDYTGMGADGGDGWDWQAVHDPDILPTVLERWRRSIDTGEPFEMIFPLRGRDGHYRPFLTRVVPIRDVAGSVVRWFGTNTDVTEQQQQEEHLKLLVNELNHRVKNTLVTVQSMAAQTFRTADDPREAFTKLESRLMGLSAAHNVLTERNWEGANIQELAERALSPFLNGAMKRVRMDGPEVWLPPQVGVALSLALHELATNAVKYGALSNDRGGVNLTWAQADGSPTLEICWSERDGPIVKAPTRRGFGSRLIERNLGREWGGEASLFYDPSGLTCRIRLELPPRGPDQH